MAEQGGECIFCAIVAEKMPAIKVYEDQDHLAFLDINPRNPGHTLVIPKKHYEVVMEMSDQEAGKLFEVVKKLAVGAKNGTNAQGISIIENNYRTAGQVVPHVHFHVIPRFETEGPASMESILSVKKMPEEVLVKLAESIKNSSGAGGQSSAPREEPRPRKKDNDFDEDF